MTSSFPQTSSHSLSDKNVRVVVLICERQLSMVADDVTTKLDVELNDLIGFIQMFVRSSNK